MGFAVFFTFLSLIGMVLCGFIFYEFFANFRATYTDRSAGKIPINKKTITEWLDEQPDYGLCDPPMDAQMALDYLFDYLDISPVTISQSTEQCNTEIVYDILMQYSPKFRREIKEWRARRED